MEIFWFIVVAYLLFSVLGGLSGRRPTRRPSNSPGRPAWPWEGEPWPGEPKPPDCLPEEQPLAKEPEEISPVGRPPAAGAICQSTAPPDEGPLPGDLALPRYQKRRTPPSLPVSARSGLDLTPTAGQLLRGILWAEILGPPRALNRQAVPTQSRLRRSEKAPQAQQTKR